MPLRFSALFLLALLFTAAPSAQPIALSPDLGLDVSGGIQPRLALGVEDAAGDDAVRVGTGLRRARLQARLLYRDVGGVEYDVDGASGAVQSVDLFAFANLSDRVQARVGYMSMAQPRSGVPTPFPDLDAVDRAAITERWLAGTLGGDGRDLGADVTYSARGLDATLSLHNGDGSLGSNFRQGISGGSPIGGVETTGLAVSASAAYTAASGVEVGAFASANGAAARRTARDGDGRGYTTAGAHLYWGAVPGSQPVRLKLDALALRYDDDGAGVQESAGVSALGAVRVLGAGEAFARVERYWDDVDASGATYATAGLSYSPSAAMGGPYRRARLTLAYHYRDAAVTPEAHLVLLQGQFAF